MLQVKNGDASIEKKVSFLNCLPYLDKLNIFFLQHAEKKFAEEITSLKKMLEEEKKVKEDLQSKYEYVWFLSCFSL